MLNEKKIVWNWIKQTLGSKEKQFEQIKNELTIYCLDQLGDENYTSWNNFITQFDNKEWKASKENKPIIKKLAWIRGYDFNKMTKQVINQDMKNETKKILDNMKNMRKELLEQKARQYEQKKEDLIAFYLSQLSDENYTIWDDFITKFDDQEWKCKNELIITKLASFLNYSNKEINSKKIDGLNKEIKNKAKILLNANRDEISNKLEEEKNLIKQFEYERDQLIVICLKQLRRKKQNDLYDFSKQFNDYKWKEKNKTIIEKLAFALDCSFDKVDKQKIYDLIKSNELFDLDKLDNNEKILNEEEKEKFEQSKNKLIANYLVQLWDENYASWDNFITKFDDQEWKFKNGLIITKLASVLNCSNEEINSKKIGDLDEKIKDEFMSLIKTNDLNNLLKMNSIKNGNLKENFNKINNFLKRIGVMYKLCCISLEIYNSLADEKIEQKTTIKEILEKLNKLHETNKTNVDQTLIKQEKKMRFLYNLMQKLNTQDVGTLIEKINNWLELIKFITYDNENEKFGELINMFEDKESM